MAGMLFLRSLEKGERAYSAMCARGYDGKYITQGKARMSKIEILILISTLLIIFVIRIWVK
jgi:energy-coupling factor transporter transmembrane protein EcfT